MTLDRPKRSTQQSHSYPDRSRQSLTFANAGTPERSSLLRAVVSRRACFLSLLILLGLAGFVAFHRGSPFQSQAGFSSDKLRQFGLPASNELYKCTSTSTSAVCKWARQHSGVNRQRPTDWEPKEGWPEELEVTQSLHHASDRALTALDNTTGSSHTTRESLQSVLHSLWPMQSKPDLPIQKQSSLPQCAALYRQPCIALVGNANVSHALQAEMQGCTVVRQLDVVTAALCASSADVWILDQASSSSTPMVLASSNEHCSRQQVLVNTKALWFVGGEQDTIAQLQDQDPPLAGIPAVHFPAALWKQLYLTTLPSLSSADLQPSLAWIGLLTVLECARADAQIHVYSANPSYMESTLHDTPAEAELLTRLHASSLIILHENCLDGTSCPAKPASIRYQSNEGLKAPGVKLYLHRKKWQDSSMRVYSEDEDEEEEEYS